jgi:hypothetical protein
MSFFLKMMRNIPVTIAENADANGIGSIGVYPERTWAATKIVDIEATLSNKKLNGCMLGSTIRFTSRSIMILLIKRGIIIAFTIRDIKGMMRICTDKWRINGNTIIADSNTPCVLKMLTYVFSRDVITKYSSVRQNKILNTFSI